MNSVLELYLIAKLVKLLTQEWTETDAYKLNIIDKHGKFLKKYRDLKTSRERLAFSTLHRFAFNLRKIIETLPGGKSKIAKYLTVWALFKEETENKYISEGFESEIFDLNTVFEEYFRENKRQTEE